MTEPGSPPDDIAARARELADEAAARHERYDSEQRPGVLDRVAADTVADISGQFGLHTAKLIRDWTRSVLGVHALKRLFDIGMGVAEFDVPTMTGRVVTVPASAGVQVKALATIVAVGVPRQLGIVDQGDGELPGVFVLGELDLDEARREAHGERYMRPDGALPAMTDGRTGPPGEPLPPMAERIAAGEFELVEIEESAVDPGMVGDGDRAPEPLPPAAPSLEQQILAKRRRQRSVKSNGHNGHHGGIDAARD